MKEEVGLGYTLVYGSHEVAREDTDDGLALKWMRAILTVSLMPLLMTRMVSGMFVVGKV